MFKKKFRLPREHIKSERILRSPLYILKLAKNNLPISRFGFVISKKIDKRATVRNRIKRKFRFCIEQNFKNIEKGYDFLFVFKKNILSDNYCGELIELLKKENLYQ